MIGKISSEFIDDLLIQVNIIDIIYSRIPLQKSGKNLRACCPFHTEKTASFTVSLEKQFYHCFGCGAHGTAISFLMEYERMDFLESVQELAVHSGIKVPTSSFSPNITNHQSCYNLLDKVSQYFIDQLHCHHQHDKFEDYLRQRGLSAQIIEKFHIGMAADSWNDLLKKFGDTEQDKKRLNDVGLLSHNKGYTYDRFRNRIMFPILNRRGRIVGFGGRVLNDDMPKYLNSPETMVFHKGYELYGLYQAIQANHRLDKIIIVEGYMDVIVMANYGINNAVATLGTAITSEHLRQLLRSAPEIIFCFDGDRAGSEASWRAAENTLPMLGGNHEFKFIALPSGEDPDSLLRKEGPYKFNQLIKNAQSYSDYFFSILKNRVNINSMDGRSRLVEIVKPYLWNIPIGVYREMLEQRLSEISQISILVLNRHLSKPIINKDKRTSHLPAKVISPVRMAITVLLQYPGFYKCVNKYDHIKILEQPGIDVLLRLLKILRIYPHLNTAAILERWRGDINGEYLQRLAQQPLSLSMDGLKNELIGIMHHLQTQALQKRQSKLTDKPLNQLTNSEKAEVRSFY
ncbi:MAG: DNA primase [Piscirickettsiaceae bacterium]|nr:DNA primase [Piscirickettsiaceae bacterium]